MISQLLCEFSDVPTVELSRLFHILAARSFVQLFNVVCQGHLNFVGFLFLFSPFRYNYGYTISLKCPLLFIMSPKTTNS